MCDAFIYDVFDGHRLSRRFLSGWMPWPVTAMVLVGSPTRLVSSGMHAVEMLVSRSILAVLLFQ